MAAFVRVRLAVGTTAAAVALSGLGVSVAAAATGPAVSSLSSTSGPVAGHVKVTVHGSGFSGVSAVLFGGAKGGSVHVLTSHTLTVTVPAHKAARLDVRVVTGAGTSPVTAHDRYTFVAPPTISSVSPASGGKTGGGVVTIHGANFVHVHKVLFSHTAGTAIHVKSSTVLTVRVPAHAVGLVDVHVVTGYGTSAAKKADRYSYVGPVVTVALGPAERGVAYSATLTAVGGTAPFTWTASGLPAGLVLSPAGVISGKTFVDPGRVSVSVSVTDHLGHSASAVGTLAVNQHAGRALAWGDNNYGEVGNQTTTGPVTSPVLSYGMTDVVQVAGGSYATYALRADGTVYSWGDNSQGELGVGTTSSTPTTSPAQVPGLSGVVALAAGEYTAYALRADGTVVGWGYNTDGEVGDGTIVRRTSPVPVLGLTGITALAAGWLNGYAIRSDGSLWSWGGNSEGGLGVGAGVTLSSTPAPIPGLSGVTAVSAKLYDTYALLSDGTMRAWGVNSYGELGDTTTTLRSTPVTVLGLTGVRQIASGDYDGYAVLADGTVRAWGNNGDGQVGDGTTTTRLSPVTVGVTDVQHIASSAYNVFVQHPDGSVQVWGEGPYGANADGTVADHLSPFVNPSLYGVSYLGQSHLAGLAVR